ncbi:MAG: hypothetical protein L0H53_13555 [Candidatus Nitrosocosmicus sp.]|nr:hypothetical protein [Candidatus Nitrosocosmicus sp.]MDN5867060.1 hypothetical protein [Candidatus Nitrosocosmicus sp.]
MTIRFDGTTVFNQIVLGPIKQINMDGQATSFLIVKRWTNNYRIAKITHPYSTYQNTITIFECRWDRPDAQGTTLLTLT